MRSSASPWSRWPPSRPVTRFCSSTARRSIPAAIAAGPRPGSCPALGRRSGCPTAHSCSSIGTSSGATTLASDTNMFSHRGLLRLTLRPAEGCGLRDGRCRALYVGNEQRRADGSTPGGGTNAGLLVSRVNLRARCTSWWRRREVAHHRLGWHFSGPDDAPSPRCVESTRRSEPPPRHRRGKGAGRSRPQRH